MRKRILLCIFAMVCALVFASATMAGAEETEGVCGENLLWKLDAATGTLTISGQGTMESFSNWEAYPWSVHRNTVFSLVIEEGITSIGDYAFGWFTELKSVSLPSTLTSIGAEAFSRCGITAIQLPDSVTTIGYGAFQQSSLESFMFPAGLRNTGDHAFFKCTNLKTVTIPYGVENLNISTFEGCSSLETVTIPDSVTNVGFRCFFNCTNLQSVSIGSGVLYLGTSSFEGCSKLQTVTIPDSVTHIESSAFSMCASLTYVSIGAGVQYLETPVFAGCNNLQVATINDSNPYFCCVNNVIYSRNMTELVQVLTAYEGELQIPSTVTVIRNSAARACTKMTDVTIPAGVLEISYGTFYGCTQLAAVTLPEGITAIAHDAFRGCTGLTELTFPSTVTYIGSCAFADCTGVTKITFLGDQPTVDMDAFRNIKAEAYFPEGNTTWDVINMPADGQITWPQIGYPAQSGTCGDNLTWEFDANTGTLTISGEGSMYDYPQKEAPWAYLGYNVKKLVLEEGVTRIGNNAFYYAGLEEGVVIPETVTQIGEFAFAYSHVVKVQIPSGVTEISRSAFLSCVWLTDVYLPDGVTVIGDSAFSTCVAMAQINIPNSVTHIGEHAFSGNDMLESITIPKSVVSIGVGAFTYCHGLKTVHTESLDAWCRISFGSQNANPVYLAGELYVNGELLTHLVIPQGITEILPAAFAGAKCLTAVTIPQGVTGIGKRAFFECTNLQIVLVPEGVLSVGEESFHGCSGLREFVIREGMCNIGAAAFRQCENLITVWLPESLTEIGENAFAGCKKLWHVMYAGAQEQWKTVAIQQGNSCLTNAIRHTGCTGSENVDTENQICGECPADLTYSCGEHITWHFDAETGTLTITGVGEMYDGLQNWDAFKYDITSLVVEEGVTTIGDKVFFDLAIESVSLPSTLKSIGVSAFEGCDLLQHIDIPDSVSSIGKQAFRYCDLQGVKLPTSLTAIAAELFAYNSRMTKAVIPAHIREMEYNVFGGTNVTLVEFLGDAPVLSPSLFMNQEVTALYPVGNPTWTDVMSQKFDGTVYWLPSGYSTEEETFGADKFTWYYEGGTLYISGDGVMNGWSGDEHAPWRPLLGLVEHVVIAGEVSDVYSRAFFGFTNLKTVSLPSSMTDIMEQAFLGCVSLTQIDLPNKLKVIEPNAFYGCSSLSDIEFAANLYHLGAGAFGDCNRLKTVCFAGDMPEFYSNAFTSPDLTIYYPAGNKTWTEEKMAHLLKSAVHADTVFKAEGTPPDEDPNQASKCGDDMTWSFSDGTLTLKGTGVMYDYLDENSVPWAHLRDKVQKIVIGDGITAISYRAFFEFKNLRSVHFGNTLKRIGGQAFRGCTKLEEMELPGSLEYIGDFSFYECKSLKVLVIPAGVTQIDVQAFYSCKGLEKIYFEGDAPYMDYPFLNVTATAYYPAGNASWTSGVMKQYGGKLTWQIYCPNGHIFGQWQQIKAPTVEETGLTERTCSQCGHAEQLELPKLQATEPTEPPTVPSEPVTEPTEPATQPIAPPTTAPTEPSSGVDDPAPGEDPEPNESSLWTAVGIAAAVVLLLSSAAVFLWKRRK